MPLNDQQEVFCKHYALSRNGAESARQAGYALDTAANQGSRLLKREDILERIKQIEEDFTTDIDVISELEKQYAYANSQGHTNSAIKALEMLARARGNNPDAIEKTPETLEKEIIRCLEILGEKLANKLLSQCNWRYSRPTAEEAKEAEELIEKGTKED